MLKFVRDLLTPPDPVAEVRAALDRMAREASRAHAIRQAGLEAVRKELEK